MKYTNFIFIRRGMCVNGRVHTRPLVFFFTVLIVHSALLTCSFAAVVLHSTVGNISLIFTNSLSINIVITIKPAHQYTWSTCSMCFTNAFTVRTGVCSAMMKMFLDNVIRNAVLSKKKNVCHHCDYFVPFHQWTRYCNVVSHHWCRGAANCFPLHASKSWSKSFRCISNVRRSNRTVLDHAACHSIEISFA